MSEIETVWLQITSGRGPAECQLAVAKLAAEVMKRATAEGLAAGTVELVAGQEPDTALSALLKLSGEGASAFARGWRGSVQWICPSPYRPGHKRKNWFVGVEVLDGIVPSADTARIDPRHVVFESMRASGAGGQHVNKTESAVRAMHKPTGLVATAREERSQAMNKKLALARLQALIDAGIRSEEERAERERWQQHDALERGRPVRVYSGEAFRARR